MNEMIERVARAIFDAADDKVSWDGVPWVELPKWYQDDYRKQARAAIEAMREPTDAMAHAMRPLIYDDGRGSPYDDAKDAWRDGVDAALKP